MVHWPLLIVSYALGFVGMCIEVTDLVLFEKESFQVKDIWLALLLSTLWPLVAIVMIIISGVEWFYRLQDKVLIRRKR